VTLPKEVKAMKKQAVKQLQRIVARAVVICLMPVLSLTNAVPLLAAQGPIDFPKSAIVLPDGKEQDVIVRFGEDELVILDEDEYKKAAEAAPLKIFSYQDIHGGEYSFSSAPRWKTGGGAALVVGIFAVPFFFLKGKKHWLALQGSGDFAMLHLDKKNYKSIILALESKTGITVESVEESK